MLIVLGVSGFLVYKNLAPSPGLDLLLTQEIVEPKKPDIQYEKIGTLDGLMSQFQKYGAWPEKQGKEGKANPFLSYFGDLD